MKLTLSLKLKLTLKLKGEYVEEQKKSCHQGLDAVTVTLRVQHHLPYGTVESLEKLNLLMEEIEWKELIKKE